MLNISWNANRSHTDCDGTTRRDFLRIGTLGLSSFGLPQLLAARADAAAAGKPVKDTSVIWLWLQGGPTHIETFDPKMSAPAGIRSVTGEVATSLPGVTFGGTFPELAKQADKLAIVRSFAHKNSGHGGGTHWVMTGYDNRVIDNGGMPSRPSLGSIVAKVRGPNHPSSGLPTYIKLGQIPADGPAFLGPAAAPFDPNGPARRNMSMTTNVDRFNDRRELLNSLDRFQRDADAKGVMAGLDAFEQQAFNLIIGDASKAFEMKGEKPGNRRNYGDGNLGRQLLMARRLCESGAAFVTINFGGWDMHGRIEQSMRRRGTELDRAVAAFLRDLHDRGLSEKILLVISGEFGRTPRLNGNGGRDHWAPLSTLALAGGGLKMGQVIGQSAARLDVPATRPITPQDLMATVFHVLGIDPQTQYVNPQGRPISMLEDGHVIPELV